MKLCTVGYVPPPSVGHPEAFLRHLARRRTTNLILFSDHSWPGVLKLQRSLSGITGTFPNGQSNKFAIPNAIFFTGVRIAMSQGYTHMITIESDCRVGCDDWDQRIWEEYFGLGKPVVAAGTLVCYNPANHSPSALRRWRDLIRRNTHKNFPVATYGWLGAGVTGPCAVFPNGALAVYDLAWLCRLFDMENTLKWCTSITAWDMAIGTTLWERVGEAAYDYVGMLETVFSGYGNLVTTQDERRRMLINGEVVAYHQEKGDFEPT